MTQPKRRYRRALSTRPSVRLADAAARTLIRIGGIGTIVAVSTVCLFLVWVAAPLFGRDRLEQPAPVAHLGAGESVVALAADDTGSVLWTYTSQNRFVVMAAATGVVLEELRPLVQAPAAYSFAIGSGEAIFGFADGSTRLLRVEFHTEYREPSALPEAARSRATGERFVLEGKVAERVGIDQFALRGVRVSVDEPIAVSQLGLHAVDLTRTPSGPAFASLDVGGVLRVTQVSRSRNFLTGKDKLTAESGELALRPVADHGLPQWVSLSGLANQALAVWKDGLAVRVDVRDLTAPAIAEEIDLLPERDRTLTAVSLLNGKNTLLAGDSSGRLRAWMRSPAPAMSTRDGLHLVLAHDLGSASAAVTSLATSTRTRSVAAGYADGSLRVFHVTTERLLAQAATDAGAPVSAIAVAPGDRAVLAWDGRVLRAALDSPHPEASLHAYLRPVWYEGYAAPEHMWQSSSASDDAEPKLGLWPLIFGTLKATVYSMLFGVPLALLAAIYTSEFLRPEARARVKPAIELMASLPSVVLGFLAALVIAPAMEGSVAHILAAVVAVPFALLLAAHVWQLLPRVVRARWESHRHFLAALALTGGAGMAVMAGPALERVLFGGDIRQWLDGQGGSALGGWLLLTTPAAALLTMVASARLPQPAPQPGASLPARALVRFMAGSLITVAVAVSLSAALSAAGLDLRGGVLGTYVQRNAMVVGFVMGFAIVPIIYTIADDALSSIPESLRAGSLALGATPWQTAIRIVVPTAASGLFSAIMVGLGRAVGETMIVLMAAGNTPVLQWNVFNGFRTLSANIAVELPEAVRNSTHYRTLFLAALALFAITFALNTIAELVRQRFRERAYQL
ncbi:MAG TPA: ABC transporter permease subunit [Candidatus Limnocylindrales bacterium]|nr:ABC transporter permease subunit [Candidatus Limnocylindrales bacterium]